MGSECNEKRGIAGRHGHRCRLRSWWDDGWVWPRRHSRDDPRHVSGATGLCGPGLPAGDGSTATTAAGIPESDDAWRGSQRKRKGDAGRTDGDKQRVLEGDGRDWRATSRSRVWSGSAGSTRAEGTRPDVRAVAAAGEECRGIVRTAGCPNAVSESKSRDDGDGSDRSAGSADANATGSNADAAAGYAAAAG